MFYRLGFTWIGAAALLLAGSSQVGTQALLMASGNQDASAVQRVDWDWGELRFDRRYVGHLTIRNDCATEQRVLIVSDRVPYLTMQRTVTLPPRASLDVPYLITPTRRTADTLSDTISGEVVVWHPRDAASGCAAATIVHAVTGRLRMTRLEDAQPDGIVVETAAIEAACGVWWLRSERPTAALATGGLAAVVGPTIAKLDEARCTHVIRPHARRLRQGILDEEAVRDPVAWRWLPDQAAIDRMSMTELTAFRRRVHDQRRK